ncbi:MAG TPA: putative monovalent cation/H+ antiporter subunit A [Marinagarivorans sp.]
MIGLLLAIVLTACIAPVWTHSWRLPRALLALVPATGFLYCLNWWPAVASGNPVLQTLSWMPSIGLSLSFYIDGLSLLFLLLVTGIGSFIILYASSYLKGHQDEGRFFLWLFLFMASMLGLVASDNLLALFVFWELTSFTSYMLIGFNHESEKSRKLALQGLFITVGGGLLLMTGFIMLGSLTGTYQLSEIVQISISEQSHFINAMLVFILLGAFTKSAQFPFHFWLPNAMAAPTPVSAFLHSATMVKAGVFIMARLHPTLSEQSVWSTAQLWAGAATMLLGAWLAYMATDLKKVLAYSTVMALGTLTLLLGIGSEYALIGFVSYLLAHSLYKASLFMLAGGVDHSTGTKDLLQLQGLRATMPVTFGLIIVGALSLAGLPPLFGFIGKELLLEAGLGVDGWLIVVIVVAATLVVGVALTLIVKPFLGQPVTLPRPPHELPPAMLAGPVVLLTLSVLFGLAPALAEQGLVHAAVQSIAVSEQAVKLKLWHGVNTALLLSLLSLAAGAVLAFWWLRSRRVAQQLAKWSDRIGPESFYFRLMDSIAAFATWQTGAIQNGRLGIYMIVLLLATLAPVAWVLFDSVGFPGWTFELIPTVYECAMVTLMLLATAYAVRTRSRFASIISLGAMGFSVALLFVHFSAPDLGITQVLVETLTVLLLVIVLIRVPGFARFSSNAERLRDAAVALFAGFVLSWVVLAALPVQWAPTISEYFIANSYELGKGRNIVNVILVDFRALDTLGEIFVLAIAALGVYSMMKLRKGADHGKA